MRLRPQIEGCPAEGGRLPHACAGSSLIELLAVLAIILILTSLYWGSNSASRQRKLEAACQANLEKINIAMDIYANDHAARFPEVAGALTSEDALEVLVPRYTADTSVFTCPGSKDPSLPSGQGFKKGRISYAYYMGRGAADSQQVLLSDRQVDTLSKAANQPVFSTSGKPPGNNHDKFGGNLLFCDGHVERIPPLAPFAIGLTQGVVLLNPR